jgi:hypothetical protein
MKNKIKSFFHNYGIIISILLFIFGIALGSVIDKKLHSIYTIDSEWISPIYEMPKPDTSILCIYKTTDNLTNIFKMRTIEIDWQNKKDIWWIYDVDTEEIPVYNLGKPILWGYYPPKLP